MAGPARPREVLARTGCRVDLAGGTLDIWPLGVLHPGAATVNVAVDLPIGVTVRRADACRVRVADGVERVAPDWPTLIESPEVALLARIAAELGAPPLEIEVESAAPRGSGLGASSSIAVATICAIDRLLGREDRRPEEVATLARDLEVRLLGLPTGTQDHYPALLGGALAIEHRIGGERVVRLDVDLEALDRHLLLVDSGESHFSARQNWQVVRRRLDGDPQTVQSFERLAQLSRDVIRCLEAGDWRALGQRMTEDRTVRRDLDVGIETPAMTSIFAAAIAAGAWGGRVCGAGGGGCLALIGPPELGPAVAREAEDAGGRVIATATRNEPLWLSKGP